MQIVKMSLSLENCFREIINGQKIEIELNNAEELLTCLHINTNNLKPKAKNILPIMLIYYIGTWPGWQKSKAYHSKEITFKEWFVKFKEYLSIKINCVNSELEKDNENVISIIDRPFTIHNNTQTSGELEQALAPFTIQIEGSPKLLNTMIFSETINGNIQFKRCKNNKEWPSKLTFRQLMNWPHVEIEFSSKDLHFKRCNSHDFRRFLTLGTCRLPPDEQNLNSIDEVDLIDQNVQRESYALNVIKEYCNLYIQILRKKQESLNWSNANIEQVEVILEDLILDLIDIDKNSIATNTKILFNIGNSTYYRNKSLKKTESVRLTEFIMPKNLLSFISFTALENLDSNPFPFLNRIENEETDDLAGLMPTISYRCTFCQRNYPGNEDMWLHLRNIHAMECNVQCDRCKQQFTILTLTEHRWRHHCLNPTTEHN